MARPLAIVQARMGSKRLPGKMLLELRGEPLVFWAWRAAVDAFGRDSVVIAIPDTIENLVLAEVVVEWGAHVFPWQGDENDVLARFHACANHYRWHPDSVIVRVTPDDPFKEPEMLLRVADGERVPVELGGEAFTLRQLDCWHKHVTGSAREHLSELIGPAPDAGPGVWTIDTQDDLDAVRAMFTLDVMT